MRVNLPKLHDYQQKIVNSKAKFKIVAIGRRGGKSYMTRLEAFDRAINRGEQVWIIFPAYSVASDHWRKILKMVGELASYQNQSLRLLEFPGGGSLSVKSGHDPDNLRGSGLDFVVMDEAAFQKEAVFIDVVIPALSDKDGTATLISTPNGKNWFYKLFKQGRDPDDDIFASWQLPSWVNPIITPEKVRVMKASMPRKKFKREIEASFEDTGGNVFVGADKIARLPQLTAPPEGVYLTGGLDSGRDDDYTALTFLNNVTGEQYFGARFTELGFEKQATRVRNYLTIWNPCDLYIEVNNYGKPQYERLKKMIRAEGLPVKCKPIFTLNTNKAEYVDDVTLFIETERILLLDEETEYGGVQLTEMSAFQGKKLPGGGIRYEGQGEHDDTVAALWLACIGLKKVNPYTEKSRDKIAGVENPFYGGF